MTKMKLTRPVAIAVGLIILAALPLTFLLPKVVYPDGKFSLINREMIHQHGWSNWEPPVDLAEEKLEMNYIQFRSCTNCGLSEYRMVREAK